jgi:KRAB domain-containing zinc finger protein
MLERLHKYNQCIQCGEFFQQTPENFVRKDCLLRTAPCKSNICDAYGKTFTDGKALLIQERIRNVVKTHGWKQGEKIFTPFGTIHTHEKSHISEKPYGCKQCGKAFSQANKLQRHERTHSGKKNPMDASNVGKPS